jgi:hypothetical protein
LLIVGNKCSRSGTSFLVFHVKLDYHISGPRFDSSGIRLGNHCRSRSRNRQNPLCSFSDPLCHFAADEPQESVS